MADKTTTLTFLSDNRDYVSGVEEMTQTTEELTQSIEEADQEQEQLQGGSAALKDSMDDLTTSVTQTTEGLIDSTTGMSGLGAAVTNTIGRLQGFIKTLSLAQKAMIATVAGAVIAGLIAVVSYWEEITGWIESSVLGIERLDSTTEELEEASTDLAASYENQLVLLRAMGATREEELDLMKEQIEAQLVIEAALLQQEARELGRLIAQRQLLGFLGASSEEIETQAELVRQMERDYERLNVQLQAINIELDRGSQAVTETASSIGSLTEAEEDPLENFFPFLTNNDGLTAQQEELNNQIATLNQQLLDELDSQWDVYHQEQQTATDNALKADITASAKAEQERLKQAQLTEEGKQNLISGTSGILQVAAGENQKFIGAIQIAEAIANTALAVTRVIPNPVAIAGVVAAGAAAVATIAQQMKVSADSGGDIPIPRQDQFDFQDSIAETAQPDTVPTQYVLVTEDLNTVQQRVTVTEQRGTLR